jgi:hypothetical protein
MPFYGNIGIITAAQRQVPLAVGVPIGWDFPSKLPKVETLDLLVDQLNFVRWVRFQRTKTAPAFFDLFSSLFLG